MNYRTRLYSRFSDIPQPQWDALVVTSHGGVLHPALRHAYLLAMEASGSATPSTGWAACHLGILNDADCLVAAAPVYLKSHSYGEYVFDWAWADAYQRHQLVYYPKLLTAIPFTPVFGRRLLAQDENSRAFLGRALFELAQQSSVSEETLGLRTSSWHGLFLDESDLPALADTACMKRMGVQFHWQNRVPGTEEQYQDFEHFLEQLNQKKRKNIRAERRKVEEAGVHVQALEGSEAKDSDWAFFYDCYVTTYRQHHSTPYLTPDFFVRLRHSMPEQVVLFIAKKADKPIAASFCLYSTSTLYGRYWGSLEHVPCLHFEAAYYAPLTWAIEKGISRFEGGAQGEHKWSRGFEPVPAQSMHWLAHEGFAEAVDRFLEREGGGISAYMDELKEHNPFKSP